MVQNKLLKQTAIIKPLNLFEPEIPLLQIKKIYNSELP